MNDLDQELVTILVVGVLVLDSLFLGVVDAAVLRLLGCGGWYTSLSGGERIIYQGRHAVISGGFNFALPNRVAVSDKRFMITIGWSRAALVIIPLDAILSTTPGNWWWWQCLRVTFKDQTRGRTVSILVNGSAQTRLMAALRSATSIAEVVRTTVSGDDTA